MYPCNDVSCVRIHARKTKLTGTRVKPQREYGLLKLPVVASRWRMAALRPNHGGRNHSDYGSKRRVVSESRNGRACSSRDGNALRYSSADRGREHCPNEMRSRDFQSRGARKPPRFSTPECKVAHWHWWSPDAVGPSTNPISRGL